MFARIGNTWTLMGASLDVLKRQKSLLIFPLLSGIACLAIIASFLAPIILGHSTIEIPAKDAPPEVLIRFYGYWFLFYFCNYFTVIFFNTAVVACAALAFEGQTPTTSDGLSAAFSRVPQIAGWALLSATVGLILRIIEDRSEKIGQFVAGLLGAAWGVVSFLAVPVLVLEKKGPFAALSTSTSLLKKTWGEQFASGFGFGMVFFLLTIPAYIGMVALFMMAPQHTVFVIGIALCVLYLVVMALIQSVLQTIFQTALYMYARDGKAPDSFTEEMMGSALVAR